MVGRVSIRVCVYHMGERTLSVEHDLKIKNENKENSKFIYLTGSLKTQQTTAVVETQNHQKVNLIRLTQQSVTDCKI